MPGVGVARWLLKFIPESAGAGVRGVVEAAGVSDAGRSLTDRKTSTVTILPNARGVAGGSCEGWEGARTEVALGGGGGTACGARAVSLGGDGGIYDGAAGLPMAARRRAAIAAAAAAIEPMVGCSELLNDGVIAAACRMEGVAAPEGGGGGGTDARAADGGGGGRAEDLAVAVC